MLARRIPRLAVTLAVALALVLAACSDDGGGGQGGSSTSGPTVPPRTDGPGVPRGDDALQAALLTKEEVNVDEDPEAPTFFANELTYGVARPADEFALCEQASPLNEVEPVAQASVSFQDFLGGEIDQRVLRYESPDAAAAAWLEALPADTAPRALPVMPVFGYPGWHPGSEHAEFYDDTRYFRPSRAQGTAGVKCQMGVGQAAAGRE